MSYKTIDQLEVDGRRVLVRVDFNVPLTEYTSEGRSVGDETRIRAALPTIRHILDSGGIAILMSHLGRPGGRKQDALSLRPVARHLSLLLGRPVVLAPATTGGDVEQIAAGLNPGEVMLLENTRFNPGEKANDPGFSRRLATLGDVYVNDAFGAAHRAHASTEGVAHLIRDRAAGFLLDSELRALRYLQDNPEHPYVALIGGAKVSDKIGVIETLLVQVDTLLVGGAMAYTFLAAEGQEIGNSLVEEDQIDLARSLLDKADGRLHLPVDHVCGDQFAADAETQICEGHIPEGFMGLDIGERTVAEYSQFISEAKTLVWNGPMGVFEMPAFANGTNAMARAVADATRAGAFSVVGGGDSVAAVVAAGLDHEISHVSTGGGAMLEVLEGRTLPGVAALVSNE